MQRSHTKKPGKSGLFCIWGNQIKSPAFVLFFAGCGGGITPNASQHAAGNENEKKHSNRHKNIHQKFSSEFPPLRRFVWKKPASSLPNWLECRKCHACLWGTQADTKNLLMSGALGHQVLIFGTELILGFFVGRIQRDAVYRTDVYAL